MQRPQRLQGGVPLLLADLLAQGRQDGGVAPLGEDAAGLAALPGVGVVQQLDDLGAGQLVEVEVAREGAALLALDAVDAAVGLVPVIDGIDVVGPLVVPVHDVEGAVGAGQAVDGAEPGVVGHQEVAGGAGGETAALRREFVPVEAIRQQVAGDVGVAEARRQAVALVDDAAAGDVAAPEVLVGDVVEVAVGVRVVQRAVLAERLPVVAALNAVQHDEAAVVGAVEQVAVAVEVEAPRVAAALAEQLELARARMPCWNSKPRTLAVTVLPWAPYSQPSGPHWMELAKACESSVPKPHSSISGSPSGSSSVPGLKR